MFFANASAPLTSFFIPIDALVFARFPLRLLTVRLILTIRGLTKLRASVVESIPIAVVDLLARPSSHNPPVEPDRDRSTILRIVPLPLSGLVLPHTTLGIPITVFTVLRGIPFELRGSLVIDIIELRVLAVGEGEELNEYIILFSINRVNYTAPESVGAVVLALCT